MRKFWFWCSDTSLWGDDMISRLFWRFLSVENSSLAWHGAPTESISKKAVVIMNWPCYFHSSNSNICHCGSAEYLANLPPPSYFGRRLKTIKIACIMKLQWHWGYINGCTQRSQNNNIASSLSSSPFACRHLINHHDTHHKTEIVEFRWELI